MATEFSRFRIFYQNTVVKMRQLFCIFLLMTNPRGLCYNRLKKRVSSMMYFWGILCAIVFFAFQLILCFRAKKRIQKMIPFFIILIGLLLSAATYFGLFGTGGRYFAINELIGLVLFVVFFICLFGILLAWVIYLLMLLINKCRK